MRPNGGMRELLIMTPFAVALGAIVAIFSGYGAAVILGVFAAVAVAPFLFSGGVTLFSKIRANVAKWRWYHYAWFLFSLSGLSFRARSLSDIAQGSVDSANVFRMGLVALVGFIVLGRAVTVVRGKDVLRFRFGLLALPGMFAVLGLVSTVWSVFPNWTAYKSAEYLVGVVLAAAIVPALQDEGDVKVFWDSTWLFWGLLLGSVWVTALIWPSEGFYTGVGVIGLQIRGVVPNVASNSVGELGAVLGIVSLNRLLAGAQPRRTYRLLMLLSVLSMVIAQSRSSITAFAVAVVVMLFVSGRVGALFTVVAGAAIAAVSSLSALLWETFRRGQSTSMFMSLSGRVTYWTRALAVIQEHPILGQGAYAAGRFGVLADLGVTNVSSLHGAWFEVAVGTGLSGVALLAAAIIAPFVTLVSAVRRHGERLLVGMPVEAVGLLSLEMTRSIFSSSAFIWHPPTKFLACVILAEWIRGRITEQA